MTDTVGADWMDGCGGDDVMYRLEGDDRMFGSGGNDWILDFEVGIDDIDLSGIIAGDFTFLGSTGFTGTAAEVRAVVTGNGDTRVLIDVDGDGVADMKIMLADVAGLTVDDFIL